MNTDILIVFAQAGEARGTLERLNAQAVEGEMANVWGEGVVPCCYRFERGWIVISSVGLYAAQMAVAKYGLHCDAVWNLGLAGALRGSDPIGSLVTIESVGKYIPLEREHLDSRTEECLSFTIPNLSLEASGVKLISSDFAIHEVSHRERLATQWDLVDMEGYGIAYACGALGKKCRMWKIVSDFASPGGRELIRKHKAELSERLADKIMESL